MARLRDVPFVLKTVGPVKFVRNIIGEVMDDDVLTMAAAMAYSWVFAIFPFLIFVISLTPLLPQKYRTLAIENVRESIQTLRRSASDTIMINLDAVVNNTQGAVLSLSLVVTLWAAGGGMRATMGALDRCYDVNKGRPFWANWLVAMAMTLFAFLMIVLVVVLIPVGNIVVGFIDRWMRKDPITMQGWENLKWTVDLARYTIGITLLMAVVSMVYQFGPSVRRKWAFITPGAVFCVLTVLAIGWAFNLYISRWGEASYLKTYGAIAGVVLLLMVFYIYAIVFLIGAEINSEIDFAITGAAIRAQASGDPLPKLFDSEEAADFKKQMTRRKVIVREAQDG